MNSQDHDLNLKGKSQYNWVKSKLEAAIKLQDVENK